MKKQQLSDRKNLLLSKQNSSAGPEQPKAKSIDKDEELRLKKEIEDIQEQN